MENVGKIDEKYYKTIKINALLVDDEKGAINTLQNMLREYCPQVQVVGIAMSIDSAIRGAKALRPDVIFLDVEMPPFGSGFDFLEKCQELTFGVIFITAYPKYAVQAINTVQPWAYLVKPFSVSELKKAVEVGLEKKIQQHHSILGLAKQQRIIVQDSRKGAIMLEAGEIVFCQADGSFTDFILWKDQKISKTTSSKHLGEYEAELSPLLFCRTHHRYIVNMDYIRRVERTGRNANIHLKNTDLIVHVSVSKMDTLSQSLDRFLKYKGEI